MKEIYSFSLRRAGDGISKKESQQGRVMREDSPFI